MNLRSKSYRIARRAGQQGARPSGLDQPEVEKLATESKSSITQSFHGHQDGRIPNPSPGNSTLNQTQKKKRNKWTREEYKDVMYCFHFTLENPTTNNTDGTFNKWRERNSNNEKLTYLDANKLANVRRYIVREKKLTDTEIAQIKEQVRVDMSHNLIEKIVRERNEDPEDVESSEIQAVVNVEPNDNGNEEEIVIEPVITEEALAMKTDILEELSKVQHTNIAERAPLLKIRSKRKFKSAFDLANTALELLCNELNPDLTCLNELMYTTGKVLQEKCGITIKRRSKGSRGINKSKWQLKLEKEIELFRKELSLLDEIQKDKILRSGKAKKVVRKYKIESKTQIPCIKEELKQKLQVKAQRMRRFEKRSKFFRQNRIFETDARKFYREINKSTVSIEKAPSEKEIQEFWSTIWGKEKMYNENAAWLKDIEEKTEDVSQQEWGNITVHEIREVLKKSHKWKSPGIDQLTNFWLDALFSTHAQLALNFKSIMTDPTTTPKWFYQGTTHLLAKSTDTVNPKNYRPITCLSTLYKLLTSILTERTYRHLDQQNILPTEQKGCRRGSYGCKDQLLINKMILEHANSKFRNLSTAWIDYKKAFDSVPHSWILRSLEIFKISPTIICFLKASMALWETNLYLSHSNGTLTSNGMQIQCGIFQGDSFSPLLFCLALVPLSHLLNNTGYGYKINNRRINHLFYMDDLKLYARDDLELEGLLQTVKSVSDDIGMEFGLDKCAKATFKRGKMINSSNIMLNDNTIIKELEQGGAYKYLGVSERNGIQHSNMKEKIRKECIRRI